MNCLEMGYPNSNINIWDIPRIFIGYLCLKSYPMDILEISQSPEMYPRSQVSRCASLGPPGDRDCARDQMLPASLAYLIMMTWPLENH